MFHWLLRLGISDKILLSLLIIVLLILLSRYRTITYNLKPLLGLISLHLLVELLADYLHFAFVPPVDNLVLYHILTPIDYLFLATIFYRTFTDRRTKQAIYWSVPAFGLLAVLFSFFYETPDQVNVLAILTESLLVTGWCFLFFRSLLMRTSLYIPALDPTFWIVVVVLFYFVGTFFISGSLNYFLKNDLVLGRKVYYAGYTFYYLLYGTIGVTCLLNFPTRTYE